MLLCTYVKTKKQFVYTTYSELVVFMYRTGKSMNILLSYCGLVDPRISASDKDLPVIGLLFRVKADITISLSRLM